MTRKQGSVLKAVEDASTESADKAPAAQVPDPIPAHVTQVLDLFDDQLEDVAFGGLDKRCLVGLADQTREKAREVAEIREELNRALEALDEKRGELTRRTSQALEYARVYAAEDPELSSLLETIARQKSGSRRKSRPTKRAKKAEQTEAEELPFAEAGAA